MMLENNQYYFEFSRLNPEKLDSRYMVLQWDKDIDEYVIVTKQLKELLATIKTLNSKEQNADEFYRDLWELSLSKFGSKSELNCFINACDSTAGTLSSDFKSFKKVVDLYLLNRDFTELTPKEWIQAIIDKGASRSQGYIGENKLVDIAVAEGFVPVSNWGDFLKERQTVAKFSKGIFGLSQIKEKLGIDLQFNSQGKMLDIIIKNGDFYLFIEAKHLKEGGGSQDKQIKELIGIIQSSTDNKKVLYGAFLDGVYSNVLLSNVKKLDESEITKNKITAQQRDIAQALSQNSTSFWFNTAGFTKFAADFV